MKTKKMSSKLALTKSTVVNLERSKMDSVRGGTNTGLSCDYCDTVRWSCVLKWCIYENTCQPDCPSATTC